MVKAHGRNRMQPLLTDGREVGCTGAQLPLGPHRVTHPPCALAYPLSAFGGDQVVPAAREPCTAACLHVLS